MSWLDHGPLLSIVVGYLLFLFGVAYAAERIERYHAAALPKSWRLTDEHGSVSPFPPHKGGGNIDCRHLVAGSTLWLPVWNDGALFSCGDAHGVQGDGEVCVSAVECAMQATLRISLRSETIPGPAYQVPAPVGMPGPYHGTMGIDPDLMEGARTAVRTMIAWLVAEHGLTSEDAYVLCSLAGDLRIHEIVDAGVWNVGMTMPLGVFA